MATYRTAKRAKIFSSKFTHASKPPATVSHNCAGFATSSTFISVRRSIAVPPHFPTLACSAAGKGASRSAELFVIVYVPPGLSTLYHRTARFSNINNSEPLFCPDLTVTLNDASSADVANVNASFRSTVICRRSDEAGVVGLGRRTLTASCIEN